jgi:heat shock 70kDa protein 4
MSLIPSYPSIAGVDVLLNKESNRETPSVVTFTSKQRQMGTDASASLSTNPRNTIILLKRLLGKKFSDPSVQADLQYLPFKVTEGPNGECLFNVEYLDKPAQLTVEQIMAAMLVDLKEIAEKEHNTPVSDTVISVPAFFTEPERYAMLAAAQIAGLNCLRLLNETTATALAYGIYKTDLAEDKPFHVAFVDVGHTATQVCVVALKKGHLAVLSNAWDRELGGRSFENALFDHFVAEFDAKHKLDIKSNPRASFRLRLAVEKAKKILTTNPEASLSVECLMNDVDVNSSVTRDKFEELIKPLLDNLLVPVNKAVKDAGLTVEQIDNVEVVGGSSRVPSVQRLLTEFFGREPNRTLNAKETVSRGCALQCAMLSPAFKVRDFQVEDSFPYAVQFKWIGKDGGVETSRVFEKGAPVPSAKMLSFFRTESFEVSAEYTEDSDIPSTADRAIGTWCIGPFTVPKGVEKAKLKLKTVLNLNGVVTVESVHVVEEEEYEEQVTVERKSPEDSTMTEADVAANGDSPAAAAAAAAPAVETQTIKKKRTKKHPVPVEPRSTHALPQPQIQKLYESECEMALQQKIVTETNDAKNAVEAYIYSLRGRIHENLAPFVQETKRDEISKLLEDAENWLYEDGEDVAKSVYISKLAELKKLGDPIERRATEDSLRATMANQFRQLCGGYLNEVSQGAGDEGGKYAHISPEELGRVRNEAEGALAWLADKEAAQAGLNKYDDPALTVDEIKKKGEMVERVVGPILSQPPPPPPPKKVEAEAEKKVEVEESMETDGGEDRGEVEDDEPMQEE